MVRGLKKAARGERHSRLHAHYGLAPHGHEEEYAHPHDGRSSAAPWTLFIIFVFGPCEPLIPVLMYPGMKTGLR